VTRDEYVSTGEAAKILNISRSTISRRFDAGLFRGKVNPITGERLLSLASIKSFVEKHRLPIDTAQVGQRTIVVATGMRELRGMVHAAAQEDDRIRVDTVAHGADTLIACSRDVPDLLVIGDDLTDLHATQVIQSLRRREELRSMKVLCCLHDTPEDEAAAWGGDAQLSIANGRNTADKIKAAIFDLLGIGKSSRHAAGPNTYQRRWPRHAVRLQSEVGLFPLSNPDDITWGRATVQNISRGGAYLADMRFRRPTLPAEPFRMLLRVQNSPIGDVETRCQVLRLASNGALSAGVKFEDLPHEAEEKIDALGAA